MSKKRDSNLKLNSDNTPVLSIATKTKKSVIPIAAFAPDEYDPKDVSDEANHTFVVATEKTLEAFSWDLEDISDREIRKNLPNIVRSLAKNSNINAFNTMVATKMAKDAKDFIRDEFYSDMKSEDVRKKHEGNFVFTGTGATPFDINK